MSGAMGSRRGSAGLVAGVVIAMMAGASGVATASEDLGGCIHFAPGEAGGPTRCPGWKTEEKNLSGRDFTGADFTGARFDWANLRGTNFTNANLSKVGAAAPKMSPQTQLRGAIVDNRTYLQGLVKTQEVTAASGPAADRYFIVAGVNPGLPTRFRPPVIPQGASIDECTSDDTVKVPELVNNQHVEVKMLRPGMHLLACTFFITDHPDRKGATSFDVKVK